MIARLPDRATLRAAWWADRTLRATRRRLAEGGLSSADVAAPPPAPAAAIRGVEAVLRRRRHSCLEGALLRQRWLAAHGVSRDVVIGVTAPADGFAAHAWLDVGERSAGMLTFHEITRLAL